MRQRLSEIIKYKGLTKSQFAAQMCATKQEISNWCAGTRMSIRRIQDLLDSFPDVDGHWFMTGQGSMLREANNLIPEEIRKVNSSYDKEDMSYDTEYYKDLVVQLAERLIKCQAKLIESQEFNIDVLKNEM